MRARALLVVAALVSPGVVASPAFAGVATVDLTTSETLVDYGQVVAVSGTVVGDPGCSAGRSVSLLWRPEGSAAFETLALTASAPDGTFAFEQSQPHTGRFRASLPQEGGCAPIVSSTVLVRVRVSVDASIVVGSAEAGDCADVFVAVTPPKPGQTVDLQHRAGGWQTREVLTLDPEGEAHARPCFGWDDVGVLRLRARWTAQDELNETAAGVPIGIEVAKAAWMRRIDRAVGARPVSVSVGDEDVFLYRRADLVQRIPASNEKLLLAMATLDTFGPGDRIRTRVAGAIDGGSVDGDLWILGRGDPSVGRSTMRALAEEIAAAGIVRIAGRVMGSTTYFRRDWDAPGWNNLARRYVNRPTALTFDGNGAPAPELEAARALSKQLGKRGVRVAGRPGWGAPPAELTELAVVRSKPLDRLLARTLRPSDNFAAEVLGKRLGAQVLGAPGTIAKGASAIEGWARDRGAEFVLQDASGLSYDNRVTSEGIVRLLWEAERSSWGDELRRALPTGGQGTLRDRLTDVRLRAKTGTLEGVSTLSGWVYAGTLGSWVEFSILSAGMPKSIAIGVEDRIVRILEAGIA